MTSAEARQSLREMIDARLEGEAGSWLADQLGAEVEAVRALMPEVPRVLGRKHLIAGFAERAGATLGGVWGELPVGEWTVEAAGRVLLLAAAADETDAPYAALFETYDRGDTDTRVAALRALNFVAKGDPEQGLELVKDAGRTYLTQLMSAAWCGNPFSAQNLSDHDYRKAVLKAFFTGVPVEGFQRLEERADAELAQSLCEYIDERLAAGRTVPRALWPIAALHPRPGLVARLIGMIEHPDREERLAAARALAKARDPRASSFVRERLEREEDPDVKAALEQAAQE